MAPTAFPPARTLSVIAAVALLVGVLEPVAVATPSPSSAVSAAGHAASSPSAASDRRTRHSITHKNANGSFTTRLSAEPMNYRDGHGNWQPIDSRVVPAQRAGYAYRNAANDFTALFKAASETGYLRAEVDGVALDLSLPDAAARTARVSGSRVSYPQVFPGVDLRYAMTTGGLKETLVLADPTAPTHYQFTLTASQHTPLTAKRLRNGAWAIMAPGHGGPLFELAPPRVDDTAAVSGSQIRAGRRGPKSAVNLAVTRTGGGFQLDLTVDQTWLHAPQRHFPVLLDPTIKVQPPALTGDFIASCPDCTDSGSPLWIGTDDTESWRAAVQFDLADLPPGATVTAATLGLWNDATGCVPTSSSFTCGDNSHTINVHRMTGAWDVVNTMSSQLAWDATVLSSYSLAAHAASGWMSWDVRSAVQNWVNGAQPNYGLLLKRATEPLDAGGPTPPGADADDPAQAPKIDVTYTSDAVRLYQPETLHSNGADLRWSAYTFPDGHPFQGYQIHRSTTANFTPSAATLVATIGDPNVTTYRDTTAAAGKAFTYKVMVNGWASYPQTVTLPADGSATKTLQLGPESNGTYLQSVTGDPNCENYGDDDDLLIGDDTDGVNKSPTNWLYRPLLQFDLRDIPADATVTSATLNLHTDWMPPARTVTVNVHRVTSGWQEGTGFGDCTGDGANWNETQGGVKWKAAGSDYDSTVLASKTHYTTDVEGWDAFNVAAAVQKWVSGQAPNLGLLLRFADETPVSVNWFAYASDNYSYDPSWRPKLSITYSDGSHAQGPTGAIASPAAGAVVSGNTQTVTAAASDDSGVAKVDFLVDGAVKATDSTAPYAMTWDTTTATNAAHSITARATDNAGNVTTSSATSVTVDNTAAPTTSVTGPAAGATVSGSAVAFTAAASGGQPISRVEFYVDGTRLTDDTTSPFSVTWNTLDQAVSSYDGTHSLTTKAFDSLGRVATSSSVSVTTANTAGSKFKATFGTTALPQAVSYDPTAATQQAQGVDVTVSNTSTAAWVASDVVLRYRWYSPDTPPVVADGADISLPADLPAGQAATLRVLVPPPTLPDGVTKAQYKLRFDLYSKASAAWFADKGNPPNENSVIVNKALVQDALGLEPYYQYLPTSVGAGMQHLVNVANGNSLLQWRPLSSAGRGLNTSLDLTYNALEKKCECQGGNNWSVGISTLTRFGNPIDIHPNNADSIAGRSNKYIAFTDADGTTHRFTDSNSDGYWEAPAGQHLYLRAYSTTDTAKKWALTTPDRTTYFYDVDGYPTSVMDSNGNTITFTESAVAPADDPGGVKKHITAVTDAGGRSYTVTYWTKADAKKPQVRGKIKRVTDHSGHPLDFDYYEDGNLLRITERGGTNADGSFLADRSFVFTYTTSDGSGPAIPFAGNRVNPDAKTPNESTRLFSVRDPRGAETTFGYLGSGAGTDRWKLASLTDRAGATTSFGYDATTRVTTVTRPLSRIYKYGYDTDGEVTSITNPKNQVTSQAWSADRQLTKVTEPTGAYVQYAFNDNGLVTDEWDQLRNHTTYEYANLAVDSGDVSGRWEAGRSVGHISQLTVQTDPKGTATATPTNDYQWTYSYDAKGNLTQQTDPRGYASSFTYNTSDGTLIAEADGNSHTTSYLNYDANGLATQTKDPLGRITQAGYDVDGNRLWTQDALHVNDTGTDPREYRSYAYFDSFHRVGATSTPKSTSGARGTLIWTATGYDANDNAISHAAPDYRPGGGAVSTTSYDTMDRDIADVQPDNSAGHPRTEYTYDSAGRRIKTTLPRGVATSTVVNDYVIQSNYDTLDRTVQELEYPKDGSATGARVTNYCYDLAGDLRSITYPRGAQSDAPSPFTSCPAEVANYVSTTASYTTQYTYYPDHSLNSTCDPLGSVSSQTYDANGNVATETDGEGNIERYTYDQADNLVEDDQPLYASGRVARLEITKYTYDGAGNLASTISPQAVDTQSAGSYINYVTAYNYDGADQLTRIKHPIDSGTRQAWTHFSYDANGNRTSVSLPVDASDPAQVGARQQTTVSYYDTGDIRTLDYPDQGVTTYDYTADGLQNSRAPAGRQPETWTYYDNGDLKQHTDAEGLATYTYDLDGNQATINDASGVDNATEFPIAVQQDYDGFDEPTEIRQRKEPPGQTPPAWRVTDYTYDANGNLQQRTDEGRTQTFGYDQADQSTSQLDAGGAGCADDRQLTTSYLRNGWKSAEAIRKSDGGCDPSTWPVKRQTAWAYNSDGSLQLLQSWKGAQTSANLVESHYLTYEKALGASYLNGNPATDTFTLQGPDTASCRAAGCVATYAYDARGRLTRWINGLPNAESSTTNYSLDADTPAVDTLEGNITSQVVTGAGAIQRDYTYNDAGQLTARSINSVPNQLYFYDKLSGNILCDTDPGYTKDTCGGDGGAKAGLRDWYAFDPLDRLKTFKAYGAGRTADSSYVYDAFDRLSTQSESHNGSVARTDAFGYLGIGGQVSSETLGGGSSASKRYTYDAADDRTGVSITGTGTSDYTYGRNPHGDISSLLDDGGAVAASYAYSPYGALDQGLSRGDVDPTNALNPFQFNDKRFDTGSGAIDMGARRYSAEDGRFLQQDYFHQAFDDFALSIGSSTENRYGFAGGNPVKFAEADGHRPLPPDPIRCSWPDGGQLYERQWCVYRSLHYGHGLSVAAAAGVIGNLRYESGGACRGVDPRCWEAGCPDHSWTNGDCGVGAGQWTKLFRKQNLLEWAHATAVRPGRALHLRVQTTFLWAELSGVRDYELGLPNPRLLSLLRGIKGGRDRRVNHATEVFMDGFEAPRSDESLGDRQGYARRVAHDFKSIGANGLP